jgi:hypothetical protein
MYGGIEIPKNAAVFTVTSRRLPGFSAANIPTINPTVTPTNVASDPRRTVFTSESFNAGQTSRLPLILRGQSNVTKFFSQFKYPIT